MSELEISRVIDAAPERVWAAFTDPDRLVAWIWPPTFGTTVDLDLRPGGCYRIASVPTAMAVSGEYREVDAPHRLVFTWRWEGEDTESLVTIEFSNATTLVVRHEGLPGDGERDVHVQGWSDCLDRLPPRI